MPAWIQYPVLIAIMLALTVYAPRLARRYRKVAIAATSLLLLFGVNATVDPPPPPRMEDTEREEENEAEGEPKDIRPSS